MAYIYVVGTVIFTVYGQLVLKWRIGKYGVLPDNIIDKIFFLLKLLGDYFILSGFLSAFIASLFWMAALSKLQLSHAYPFMSLSFILVLSLSGLFLGESVSTPKIIGITLIALGVIIGSRG